MAECVFCGQEAAPGSPAVMYAIRGFEELRSAGGANMVHLRLRSGEVAHSVCVELQKKSPRARIVEGVDLETRFRATVKRGVA